MRPRNLRIGPSARRKLVGAGEVHAGAELVGERGAREGAPDGSSSSSGEGSASAAAGAGNARARATASKNRAVVGVSDKRQDLGRSGRACQRVRLVEEGLGPVMDVGRGGGESREQHEHEPPERAGGAEVGWGGEEGLDARGDLAAAEGEPGRRRPRRRGRDPLGRHDRLRDEDAVAARAGRDLVTRLLAGEGQRGQEFPPDEGQVREREDPRDGDGQGVATLRHARARARPRFGAASA